MIKGTCGLPDRGGNERGRSRSEQKAWFPAEDDLFDYIVVGAGAAGIPLSQTLAESGAKVLLIERGGDRSDSPEGLTIGGTGLGLLNKDLTQDLLTLEGVRSHIGNVMSGGTAVNLAIWIQEKNDYFDFIREEYGADFDPAMVNESYTWVREQLGHPMPFSEPYGSAWQRATAKVGWEPYHGESFELSQGSWNAFSLFEQRFEKDLSPMRPRRATDEILRMRQQEQQTLKTIKRTTVHKLHFVTDEQTGNPRIECVGYAPSPESLERVDSLANSLFETVEGFFDMFPSSSRREEVNITAELFGQERKPTKPVTLRKACIKKGGEVILSAGAIYTPALLMNNGVGPREIVEDVRKLKMVKEVPDLGKNLMDRNFVPVDAFFEPKQMPDQGYNATLVQVAGLLQEGTGCKGFGLSEMMANPTCAYVPTEELSGAQIAEGVLYATRFVLPPHYRSTPEVDWLVTILSTCSANLNDIVCIPFKPLIQCLRSVAALFTFNSVPRSRGSVTINKKGDPIVSANYYGDPEGKDLRDAVYGLQRVLRAIGTGEFEGIFQKKSPLSCPLIVLNGVLDLAIVGQRLLPKQNPIFEAIETIRRQIEFPPLPSIDAFLRLIRPEKTTPPNYNDTLTQAFNATMAAQQDASTDLNATALRLLQEELGGGIGGYDDAVDMERRRHRLNPREDDSEVVQWLKEEIKAVTEDAELRQRARSRRGTNYTSSCFLGGAETPGVNCDQAEILSASDQLEAAKEYALFPPLPKDLQDPESLGNYVRSHGSSIWHWTGSAAMGKVVGNDFRVCGIDDLSIVDASVVPMVTRMNPMATYVMLGRYAGLYKVREKEAERRRKRQ
ncbi:unnamed protein product [Vitrella brassicaformis CCMP3155]|uniref:Glucose-methanol-choline oxidoreductase N-terminal domain-containing protein n=2 Tax=Vitrella brassicaformis TaxID=1169539 RepID=A0A0G4F657_VITBC|nr:unnamed protein product [Vitrella brassicaformis CCMP3155]|eukprot:CEM07583.1 unnamed protein product [Vitrella brassicaformis CCMP3155]